MITKIYSTRQVRVTVEAILLYQFRSRFVFYFLEFFLEFFPFQLDCFFEFVGLGFEVSLATPAALAGTFLAGAFLVAGESFFFFNEVLG